MKTNEPRPMPPDHVHKGASARRKLPPGFAVCASIPAGLLVWAALIAWGLAAFK
ncbi:hypothetical protein [Salipiger thiooxidans]|jgi:hypothetical protein|uniref:hypothetical protein n=1 Tax=Salipiger thiooxidans TaxID=282683 RepID=UPI001CD7E7D3|nr:hypothetical protein [Salipiger thiooxidans]MCA0851222.1 hypothetical protein [Salipiger thiooxidans]